MSPADRNVPAPATAARAPLVAHVVFRLDVGGLENGIVNLINTMDPRRYRHAIICLKAASAFAQRLRRENVEIVSLHKREGTDLAVYGRLGATLRRLRPAIVHTRNSGTLECLPVAAVSGVKLRVHGLHGWDMDDLNGASRRHRVRQRLIRPFVTHYTAVSRDLARWAASAVGVPPHRLSQIYNGVDTVRFNRAPTVERHALPSGFARADGLVIGAVGRMEQVKDPITLIRAFVALAQRSAAYRERVRLVYIGEGRLRDAALRMLRDAGLQDCAWLPGSRNDVPELMRMLDVFVLPSLNEGISNTVLEAMASGLPVVATAVGGNPELVVPGSTGRLVPAANPDALAAALDGYLADPAMARAHGAAARARVEREFSVRSMVARYENLYDSLLDVGVPRLATGDL